MALYNDTNPGRELHPIFDEFRSMRASYTDHNLATGVFSFVVNKICIMVFTLLDNETHTEMEMDTDTNKLAQNPI